MGMIHVRVNEILAQRQMTQKALSKQTGLRPNTISAICQDTGTAINKTHLAKIADALGITRIEELITLDGKEG